MNIVKMNRELWYWFNEHLPILEVEDTCGLVALLDGKPVAGCVFDNFTHTSVQVHLLILNPIALRGGFYEACGEFVFDHCGKHIVYGMVPGDNLRAIRFNRKMGWKEVFRIKGAFKEGVDYVIMELTKECYTRSLSERLSNGKEKPQFA